MTDDQIIEKLGLTDVDDESREILVAQVNSVVEMRLMGLVESLLSDEQAEQLKQLIATGDNQAVWQWLNTELTNIDELRQGVLADYLEERTARG